MLLKKITPSPIKKVYHWLRFYFEKAYFITFYNVKCFKKSTNQGYYGQYGQDYYLDKIIIPSLNSITGIIVEVGCNDPVYNNNTFFFQKKIKTISIDPLDYNEKYKIRKNTTFVNCAVSDRKGILKYYKVKTSEGWENQMSGFTKPEGHFEYDTIKVPSDTLNNILKDKDVRKISLLLLDVEGHEYNILSRFDFAKYKPDIVVVENKIFGKKVRKLLKTQGYQLKYRFWTADDVFINQTLLH